MSEFALYFSLGYEHILNWQAYDHILFVMALCTIYTTSQWRKVLVLVTAFTLGHSLTLALVVLDVIRVHAAWVEFLIPVTILLTAVSNLLNDHRPTRFKLPLNYYLALFFGLIHGMGFSNYLKNWLGKDVSIVSELLAFNLGLELGQIVVVVVFMVLGYLICASSKVSKRDWVLGMSSAIAGASVLLILNAEIWN